MSTSNVFQFPSVHLATPAAADSFLVPALVRTAETTFVRPDENVDPMPFACLIAYCVAASIRIAALNPFSNIPTTEVLFLANENHQASAWNELGRLSERSQDDERRNQAKRQLHLENPESRCVSIVGHEGLESRRQLEIEYSNCKLWIVSDLASWANPEKPKSQAMADVLDWFSELNERGIAVLALTPRCTPRQLANWSAVFVNSTRLQLAAGEKTWNSEQIVRIGAKRTGANAEIEEVLSFWYTTVGAYEFEIDFMMVTRPLSPKKLEIQDRRREISELLKAGKKRSEIARQLNVSVATIYADCAEMYR